MNEQETEFTLGATEGTGERPKKKTAAKKAPAKKKAVASATKNSSGSSLKASRKVAGAAGKKKAGAAKKSAAPVRASGGGKKVGKSAIGSKVKAGAASSRKKPGKLTPAADVGSPAVSAGTVRRTRTIKIPEGVDIAALKPRKLYGITRVNQVEKKNVGWYVRVRGADGKIDNRVETFFSDKKHGSEGKALKAATAERDRLYATLPDTLKYRASRKRG